MKEADMSFATNAAARKVIESNSPEEFIKWLKTVEKEPFGAPPHTSESFLQGDIFDALPFLSMKKSGELSAKEQLCLILNNTCDLQPGRSTGCNLAFALKYEDFKTSVLSRRDESSARNFLSAVEKNEVFDLFFIRDCPGFDQGLLVLLQNICTIPYGLYEEATKTTKRVASLTQTGFFHFLVKMTKFIARPESMEVTRI